MLVGIFEILQRERQGWSHRQRFITGSFAYATINAYQLDRWEKQGGPTGILSEVDQNIAVPRRCIEKGIRTGKEGQIREKILGGE